MAQQLPQVLQNFIDYTNKGDSEGFVQLFAPDAKLNDWGRVFTGHTAIAQWNDDENIGTQSSFRLVGSSCDDAGTWTLTIKVSGNGFNGTSPFQFTLVGEHIATMTILPN